MQPHHAMLGVPVSTKPKRRIVHLSPSQIHKSSKSSPDQIHIRELTVNQGGLGCAIWDGSIVLARWLFQHHHLLKDQVGMELGAGVGVPGIVAARYSRHVILTDYMDEVVANLAYNLSVNANIPDEEDDEVRDEVEIQRRNELRRNIKRSGSSALLDWHTIDPDDEDLERMKEEKESKESEAAEAVASTAASSYSSSSSGSAVAAAAASIVASLPSLSSRLAALPFTPSPHFTDPTSLGPNSCDYLLGAELIYVANPHHQDCFRKILTYYLKPGVGRYYCVQSRNREGMPTFVASLLSFGFTCYWQHVTQESGLLGVFRNEKQPKGFVQREEEYVFYCIVAPPAKMSAASADAATSSSTASSSSSSIPSSTSIDLASLSLTGGTLLDASVHPVPDVRMLHDGAETEKEKI